MNRRFNHGLLQKVGSLIGAAALVCQAGLAQTIPNPSFEANSFSKAPGLISDNTAITGWTADVPTGAGLNPAGGSSTYADNGAIPDKNNVAFILGGTTLSTTMTGLTVGTAYRVTFRAAANTNQVALARVSVNGQEVLAVSIYPPGGTAPYSYVAFDFTATAASEPLAILNDAAADVALLLDGFTIAPSSQQWTISAWTGDADSGVDAQYPYTHAYNFGSSANLAINGVAFTGVGGANPKVTNQFSTTFFGNVYAGDANNITGAGATLAHDFVYGGTIAAGKFQSITLNGLTPGKDYVLTLYTMGWEAPDTIARWATFSVGEDRLTINQDQFDNNNGLKIAYRYKADASGTATLTISPLNNAGYSIHAYGFSNREAVSRNSAPAIAGQPAGTTVAAGLPIQLTVLATGFPAPTYQWRFNGTPINATTATNSIAQASAQTAGAYDVIVANSLGAVTSVVARVVVGLPVTNSSFEADTFDTWPGYSADPNPVITGWTQSKPEGSGINPISDGRSPFADNGTIPNGKQVAFIQADSTLMQTVSGFTAGSQYYLHYYENARGGGTAGVEVQLGSDTVIPAHSVNPVGGNAPYYEMFSDVFTATKTSNDLTFVKSSPIGGDNTLLLDNVTFVPVPAGTSPTIVQNPQGAELAVGKAYTFSARFIGSTPATYQWLKNGNVLSGATGSTLTLTNIQAVDEADYSAKITNAAGNATTTSAHLKVLTLVPGIFGTGLDAAGNLLAAGAVDPHYKMTASADPDFTGPDAIVVDDAWPVAPGVWLLNGPDSKWIAPQEAQGTGNAEGDYTYETTFDLTGWDLSTIQLVGQWAVDNTGTDIVLNGKSTGFTSTGFNAFTPFTLTTNLIAGKNTLVFKMTNLPATPNPTAIRVDLKGVIAPKTAAGANLKISLSASKVTISWPATPAGQKLQSATDLNGKWTDIPGASNPFTTNAVGTRTFYRTVR